MQNFGKIKNGFNDLLAESLITKNNFKKSLFKKYIKTIKESEILKTQFLIYNNIENKVSDDTFTDSMFINENLKLLEKYKISDIIKENNKLSKILNNVKVNTTESYDLKLVNLHDSLSTLIITKKTPNNLNLIVKNITEVLNYIKENKLREIKESINLPNTMLTTIMVDKYNERYSELNESEKAILKLLVESNDDGKKEIYTNLLKECIILVNENIKESSLDTKEKLLNVKDKLLNDTSDINLDFFKKISKLIDLKSTLIK